MKQQLRACWHDLLILILFVVTLSLLYCGTVHRDLLWLNTSLSAASVYVLLMIHNTLLEMMKRGGKG